MSRCQHMVNGYIWLMELRGLWLANLILGWCQLEGTTRGKQSGPVWLPPETTTSTPTQMTTFLFLVGGGFWAWFTGWHWSVQVNAEVCNYFTFAEQGVAVALWPGDILLFNPVYEHCLPSHTSVYETKDVFSLSMYLKTAIVSMNDNSLPLTEIENCFLWWYLIYLFLRNTVAVLHCFCFVYNRISFPDSHSMFSTIIDDIFLDNSFKTLTYQKGISHTNVISGRSWRSVVTFLSMRSLQSQRSIGVNRTNFMIVFWETF
jgi:hypothetical protein